MNGETKEYDKYNDQLIFSGKYLNGKRNGKGTEYKSLLIVKSDNNFYSSRNIKYQNIEIFCGEYFNGERKDGEEYNYDGELVYEGEYLNDKKNGKGKCFDDEGRLVYEGDYKNCKRTGIRKLYSIIDILYHLYFNSCSVL